MKWVTERRPHIDRCASAWYIRRFADPRASFQFVVRGETPPRGATPFDLPGARLGHRGDRVTFDALRAAYPRKETGLGRMADLVRDIDLGRFRKPESRGVDALLFGILLMEPDDVRVLEATAPIFESLHRYFSEEGGL